MSWNTPVVPVSGTLVTAAWGSTTVVENLLELRATPQHRCAVYRATTQTVAAGASTPIAFTAETEDTSAMHDTVTNNSRITIPSGAGGRYDVVARIYAINLGGDWYRAWLRKNGSGTADAIRSSFVGGGGGLSHIVALGLALSAGEYLELVVTSNGADNAVSDPGAEWSYTRLDVRGALPPT